MNSVRPKFDRPPLIEQAITVVFEELEGFSIGDFGLFWDRIGNEFSTSEAQQSLDSKIETFEGFQPQQFQFRLVPHSSLPRCFYRHVDGREIIQLQSDRFTFNWIQVDGNTYPHADVTVARFRELFATFKTFVADRGLGEIIVRQCEIVNVNVVPVTDFGKSFSDAGRAFVVPAAEMQLDFLPVESYIVNTQHLMLDGGRPIGRLYSVLAPVLRTGDDQHAYRLELTARGAPIENVGDGVSDFFDRARTALNAAFLAATTKWAHEFWGVKNG